MVLWVASKLISIGRSSVKVTAAPATHGAFGRGERGDPRGEWKAFCNRRQFNAPNCMPEAVHRAYLSAFCQGDRKEDALTCAAHKKRG